jgi:hypothetical protein
MSGLSGVVQWEQIATILAATAFVAGLLGAVFRWVYQDNLQMRAEIQRVGAEARDGVAKLREDVAIKYITTETHSVVARTVEKAIDDLKIENRDAIDRMSDRIDKALLTVAESLRAR